MATPDRWSSFGSERYRPLPAWTHVTQMLQ